jgi:hypothetical protein
MMSGSSDINVGDDRPIIVREMNGGAGVNIGRHNVPVGSERNHVGICTLKRLSDR